MTHEKLEVYCKIRNIEATFVNGILIKPLPVVKSNYRVVTDPFYIFVAINRFGCKTVVESMFNKKLTLIL